MKIKPLKLLIVISILLFPVLLSAEEVKTCGSWVDNKANMYQDRLGLSDEQAMAIVELYREIEKKDCKQKRKRHQKRLCKQEFKSSKEDQLIAILTEDQVEAYYELKEERRKHHKRNKRLHKKAK